MNELLNFIMENFWLCFLIIALLCEENYRPAGIIILMSKVLFGTIGWIIIVSIMLCFMLEACNKSTSNLTDIQKQLEGKKELKEEQEIYKRQDPDES